MLQYYIQVIRDRGNLVFYVDIDYHQITTRIRNDWVYTNSLKKRSNWAWTTNFSVVNNINAEFAQKWYKRVSASTLLAVFTHTHTWNAYDTH